MKKFPLSNINPALDEQYKRIKLSPEYQKKHDDLVAMLARLKAKEDSKAPRFIGHAAGCW